MVVLSIAVTSSARADISFEGQQFGNIWKLDPCIAVTTAGMSITCPPAVNPAIGCYARIGDASYNVPTGLHIEMESTGYAWLSVFDNCGWLLEFQPQPCCDYTFYSIRFQCTGNEVNAGHSSPWRSAPQTWAFDVDTTIDSSGRYVRRLVTTAPDGTSFQNEVVMPAHYPLMGELSFYYGAGRGCTTTIKKVIIKGNEVVEAEASSWGSIKALYR